MGPGDLVGQRYRKLPVYIHAKRFDGSPESAAEIINWMAHHGETATWSEPYEGFVDEDGTVVDPWPGGLKIPTLEGPLRGAPGDYIIQGIRNEFYPYLRRTARPLGLEVVHSLMRWRGGRGSPRRGTSPLR